MSTKNVVLTIVAGGVGPAIDVSQLAGKKTLTAEGFTQKVVIEASADGVNFCPITSFENLDLNNPLTDKFTLTFAATHMRVDATNAPTLTSVNVEAERGLMRSVVIPSPPAGGTGASVDVSLLGCLTSIYMNDFAGPGQIRIEISGDDVNFSPALKKLNDNNCVTDDFSAVFIRAVSTGSATATLNMASEEPAISWISGQTTSFMWDAHGLLPASPGRYAKAAGWLEMVDAIRALNGGPTRLQFAAAGAGFFLGFNIAAHDQNAAVGIPAGTYDLPNCIFWAGGTSHPAQGSFRNVLLDLGTGVIFTGVRNFQGPGFIMRNRSLTTTPFGSDLTANSGADSLFRFEVMHVELRKRSGAAPLFKMPDGQFCGLEFGMAQGGLNGFFGNSPGSELIEIGDSTTMFIDIQSPAMHIDKNTIKGPSNSSLRYEIQGTIALNPEAVAGGGNVDFQNQPNFLGVTFVPKRGANLGTGPGVIFDDVNSPVGSQLALLENTFNACDPTNGNVFVKLPPLRAMSGTSVEVLAKDVFGTAVASTNEITITPDGTDEIEDKGAGVAVKITSAFGQFRFNSIPGTGIGKWFITD